jgi:hypothetical protein
VSRKTKICYLESPAIVDKQVSGFHVSVENVVVMEVLEAFEQLEHVALDLRFLEFDVWVVEKARQIVVHVGRNHVQYCALATLGLGALYCHFFELQDVVVGEHLKQLDFPECSDRKPVLFVVHQYLLERKDTAGDAMSRLVHFAKGALAELLHHFILANLGAPLEAAL